MRVLLVFPRASYRVDAFVACAPALGIELSLVTDLPIRRAGLEVTVVDFADVDAAGRVLSGLRFDGVVAVDERSAVVAALAAEQKGRRHHSLSGVIAARDKRAMRAALANAGVAVPGYRVLAAGQTIPAGVPFPCVVKPPMLSGSQGVIRADDATQLALAVERTRRILHHHPSELRALAGFFDLLIEDYVDGPEVAVDGIMRRGRFDPIAIFDKPDALEGPFFEETLYVTPSRHHEQTALHAVSERAAAALGLDDGPIHVELRLAAHGPVVIEIAARSIGGLCAQVFRHVTLPGDAASLEALLLSDAVGRAPPAVSKRACASGVMMIPVPHSGVLRDVTGQQAARALDGVDGVDIVIERGQAVRALPEGSSYLGFVFAHADDPQRVIERLRSAHAALCFELSPLLAMV